ncbi:sulfotransferase [Paenibacillus ehimensis]|uniref:sulfotransferase n=1 Tax=Paenibacillus ehimensis TaxID=79264 RepID=UPI000AC08125|nr:sulfotransferase [Paenibacillus ehimensis]
MDIIISAVANRTGSTLVQRIFNARRKTLIWGEHGGIVTDFVRIGEMAGYFSIQGRGEKEAYFKSGEDPNTWIANMSPDLERIREGVVQAVKACFNAMYAEHRDNHDRIGFKEVRYGKPEIELLKVCYPDAVIVLLVRHPVGKAKHLTGRGMQACSPESGTSGRCSMRSFAIRTGAFTCCGTKSLSNGMKPRSVCWRSWPAFRATRSTAC